MTENLPGDLRALVAQVVHEVVADVTRRQGAPVPRHPDPAQRDGPQPTGPQDASARTRVHTVRLTGDKDLQDFTYRLLGLFENPKTREDLRAGRLRFHLAGGAAAPAAPGAVERIESGAVTERRVEAAARSGTRLVLGRRAVLTPLAREKARTLGVPVEKERR